ncbi:permease for cytosine/purines, uracil, thiamine, allantoin-domain-containing protein [Aspergillus ambiguus]|uniref:permease for cytosine/purines, uracil, thiamine, allantoin-domain-containing protein n=1 Tax=Aspergillus ambiguus TaxID=176160 RepID=UPI003CCDA4C1
MALIDRLRVSSEYGQTPNRWVNYDIQPVEWARRTWTFWTYHNLWVLVNANISNYMSGSSLIALGLTWRQALAAIIAGNALSTGLVILNSLPGAYYHIGFPLVNRYVWGLWGSYFVIMNRILLSLVGVQSWIGGECVYVCLRAIWPSLENRIPNHMSESTGMTTAQFVAYIIFMVLSLPIIYIRPHKLKPFFNVASMVVIVFLLVMLIWSLATMGDSGFGKTISSPGTSGSGWDVAFGIVSTMGGIAAGILNQNDYSRFSRRPRDAILGQVVGFPIYAIACAVIGIIVTAATQNRYGEALWSLPTLLEAIIDHGGSRSRAAAFFGGAAVCISQLGVNIPGNALSGGFDTAALFPEFINVRRGAYLTALISMVCNPWKLANTATTFLSVLSSYSVFLGPMVGCMIVSYLAVMRRKIKVEDLFPEHGSDGIYWYTFGINWRAPVAVRQPFRY